MDNSDKYQTRPEKLELTLTRQIEGGDPETVTATPTWENKNTDKWTYTYKAVSYTHLSKEWTDDSDIIHRQPVKIGVYVKEEVTIGDRTYAANEKIAETELNEGNVWFDWVGIGEIEPDNVYILETKVGNANVPLSEENPNVPQAPIEYDEKGYTAKMCIRDRHTGL